MLEMMRPRVRMPMKAYGIRRARERERLGEKSEPSPTVRRV